MGTKLATVFDNVLNSYWSLTLRLMWKNTRKLEQFLASVTSTLRN